MTHVDLADLIRGARLASNTEEGLQEALHLLLLARGVPHRREVRVAGGRVDLLVGRVAVEAKIAGSTADLSRQVARYLDGGDVDGVVVVTSRVEHLRAGRDEVEVVTLAWAGL